MALPGQLVQQEHKDLKELLEQQAHKVTRVTPEPLDLLDKSELRALQEPPELLEPRETLVRPVHKVTPVLLALWGPWALLIIVEL